PVLREVAELHQQGGLRAIDLGRTEVDEAEHLARQQHQSREADRGQKEGEPAAAAGGTFLAPNSHIVTVTRTASDRFRTPRANRVTGPSRYLVAVPMRLYDTAKQRVVPFEPGPTVRLYVCGITPYDSTHLGHAATYLSYDLLIRRL